MPVHDPKSELGQVAETPGVYRFFDLKGNLLYVGKAKNLRKRVNAYFEGRGHGPHIHKMVEHIHSLETTLTNTENEALILEQRLIQSEKPKYNIIFRDDKTYAYIKISSHASPQISIYRGKKEKNDRYFGPYTDSRNARETYEFAQKTFLLRNCQDSVFSNRSRACVLHQIGRCSAPCVGHVRPEDYQKSVEAATRFLKGEDKELISGLTKEMEQASELMHFEQAGRLRDQIHAISAARSAQSIESSGRQDVDIFALAQSVDQACAHMIEIRNGIIAASRSYRVSALQVSPTETLDALASTIYSQMPPPKKIVSHVEISPETLLAIARSNDSVEWVSQPAGQDLKWLELCQANAQASLQQKLGKERLIQERQRSLESLVSLSPLDHIECFDISHFQAEAAVASCVVYRSGGMSKSEYRIFNISAPNAGDDYASMKEALIRRYQGRNPEDLPQLVLIDGGIGQVNFAQQALGLLDLNLPLLGVAKGPERKAGEEELIPSWGPPAQKPGLASPALQLVQMIRDESHRFAITQNRNRVSKKRGESLLLAIPGIGASKRKALLLTFGSAKAVSQASEEELQKVPGVSLALAKRIAQHLRSE